MRWARGGGDQRGEATQEFTARPVNCCYASSGKEGNRMLPEHALYDLRSQQPGAREAGLAFADSFARATCLRCRGPFCSGSGRPRPHVGSPLDRTRPIASPRTRRSTSTPAMRSRARSARPLWPAGCATCSTRPRPPSTTRSSLTPIRRMTSSAATCTAASRISSEGDRGGALNAPRLVVVDNNASVRGALEELLTAAGYEVDTHASAESFLESGRLSSTDCLLLDVRLSAMSGLALQEHLDRLDARIPIVLMSGYAGAILPGRASAGVVEFLEKPFSDRALLGAIERALRAAPCRLPKLET